MVGVIQAKEILSRHGWLSLQPEPFQLAVLRRSDLTRFAPGDIVYRLGDPLGGVYGLVAGAVTVTTAPPVAAPRLFHVGTPGSWIGEGPYLSRQPRRVGMQAAVETWMMHLPLEAMDQMEREDPTVVRRFAQILLINLDILVHAFYDLQKHDADRRIASALGRVNLAQGKPIPVSQTELGMMSNASRKHVNVALRRFEALGWLVKGYRSITITNAALLRRFAEDRDND